MKFFALIAAFLVLTLPHRAAADETWDLLQITCSPDFDYFSIRMLFMYADPKGREPIEKLAKRWERSNNLYLPESINEHPYTCKLPSGALTVHIENFVGSRDTGECGAVPRFDVVIRNGKKEFKFMNNRCGESALHQVEYNAGQIRDCILPDTGTSLPSGKDLTCRGASLTAN